MTVLGGNGLTPEARNASNLFNQIDLTIVMVSWIQTKNIYYVSTTFQVRLHCIEYGYGFTHYS